jgi:hypothetical protein
LHKLQSISCLHTYFSIFRLDSCSPIVSTLGEGVEALHTSQISQARCQGSADVPNSLPPTA